MTQEEKRQKIETLGKMIIELKTNPDVNSRLTIQKLQQELDKLISS